MRLALGMVVVAVALGGPAEGGDRDGYVLLSRSGAHLASLDMESFVRVQRRLTAPVLWVRRGGQAWEVRDGGLLERAFAAVAPLEAVGSEQEELERRHRPLYREEEGLDREEERLDREEDRLDSQGANEGTLPARRRALEARQRELSARLRAAEREEEQLDARAEAQEAEAERALQELIAEAFRRDLVVRVKGD